jgi:hypothetical protein
MNKKYYEIWPGDQHQNKFEIQDWCHSMFGPGNIEELGWSVTSRYDGRPQPLCPFLLRTTDPHKATLFALRWS